MRRLKEYLLADIWPIGVIMYLLLAVLLGLAATVNSSIGWGTALAYTLCYWAGWLLCRVVRWRWDNDDGNM